MKTITLDYDEYLQIKEEIRIINEKLEKTPCMIIKDNNSGCYAVDIRYIPFYNHLGELTIRHPSCNIVSENEAVGLANNRLQEANRECKKYQDLYFDIFNKVKNNPMCKYLLGIKE